MGKHKKHISDASFSLIILAVSLVINIGLQSLLNTQSFVSDVFILGMFFISLKTHGYLGGSTASLLSMLIVNFVFAPLYYELDFVAGKNLPAAIIM